ncbi:hypothetical protein SVXHr_1064 [Halorhabdus sp. SVX81]|uniref:hypothetical protein n=1 Tax=Halorhabdus sp. SVX81 TaxID=2978283 RepID=UPI0023DBDBD7|nr:hypothetical protein [Halorhabdus sp. SVX81]WEL17238.1 hypothetical protein SVXHr_1064 [Halorhabdus sp. SVX81]
MDPWYALREIRKHGTNPQWWRKRFLTHIVSRYYRLNPPSSDPLVTQDWDNALLLDACRYDLFEDVLSDYPLPGTLGKRRSAGSGTPEYLKKNFEGRQLHDTVYITANPYVNTKLSRETFYDVVPVWKHDWDEELQTVPPEAVRDCVLEANDKYPNKRIIAHFNQPHVPFIGDVRLDGRKVSAIRQEALGKERPDPSERIPTPFDQLAAGGRTYDEVYEAYRSNLVRVLPTVTELLDALPGLTAVTSDHGNAFGELARPFPIKVYGHPLGILIPALTEVPWHVSQNGDRKQVTAGNPAQTSHNDDPSEDVQHRLRQLGYAE